ncbi:MAG: DUF3568 family protein [Candidatus Omnitrophica bacterium]|nr:DUF3568 family protein [Candidatus Omnitrophota bacterium]
MFKKIAVFIFSGLLLTNIYGCLLLAGAAGGTGTAVWLSGKLTQEVNAPLDNAARAAKVALKSLQLEVAKETTEQNVVQIISKYSDGKTIWIDIHRITEASSKIEVRVGAVSSDKEAADKILKRIIRYL